MRSHRAVDFVSSANIYTFDVTVSGRSLIYNRKRTGPRTFS